MIKLNISWESWSRILFSLVKPLPPDPNNFPKSVVFFFFFLIFNKLLELFNQNRTLLFNIIIIDVTK